MNPPKYRQADQMVAHFGNPGAPSMTADTERHKEENSESQTDLQLVKKVRHGDRPAFDLLVVKYQSRVASIISRYVYDSQEVMDLTQEAFVKAYRAIDRFRGDSAFYTWLYRIAVNTAKNFLESRGRRPQGSADAVDAENYDDGSKLRDNASPEKLLQRDQLQEALREAIGNLPEELRSAFLLREYDGLSYEDIAGILECPIGTVRSRIFRARDAVDRHLGPLLNDSRT
ncbi:RNA polymerase sigma factor RpoE [Marinobacter denitrificans]|uniref:RNA polymerase sigma factor RpoE n=1 Tax=Marinobacter TaxID=2742 RepID=UPI00384B33F5